MQPNQKTEILIKTFAWFVLIPALFLTFIITLIAPQLRESLADILATGFFCFVAILIIYAVVEYWKQKKIVEPKSVLALWLRRFF